MKQSAPLARKTPLRSKSAKPRRVAKTCSRLRCNRPPARGLAMCLTHLRQECDRLFSLIVRSRGVCFRCGTDQDLQASHTVPRSYLATRWTEEACEAACKSCHHWQHMHPLENQALIDELMPDRLMSLRLLALYGDKPEYVELLPRLEARWAQIRKERDS